MDQLDQTPAADQTTPSTSSDSSTPLQRLKAKSPAYQKLSDQEFADKIYDKYYAGKIKRADYDVKIGLVKAASPEEQPKVNVGGTAFTAAAHAAEPFVDVAAGVVQHGGELLHGLGLPVDPDAAAALASKIRTNFKDFTKRSQEAIYKTTDEEHPYASAGGDVAGQLLLYSTAGAPFMEGALGRGLMKAGPIVGRMLQGMAQAGTLETLKSDKKPGTALFSDAVEASLSGAIGAGIGAKLGSYTLKAGNALIRSGLVKQLEGASKGWTGDNEALAKAFQNKISHVAQTRQRLGDLAQKALMKDGIVMKDITSGDIPSGASKQAVEAVKMVRQYDKDTEFLKSNVFDKLKNASESGDTFYSANESILKKIMGQDKELSQRVWKAFSPNERVLLQKGIVYDALQKAAREDGTYDATKLTELFKEPGVKEFFPAGTGKMLDGFVNLAEQVKYAKSPGHSLVFANQLSHIAREGVKGAAGFGMGYEYSKARGGEGEQNLFFGIAGMMAYLGLAGAVSKLMGTQAGRNFLSSAATIKPGTPAAARAMDRLITLTGTSLGGTYGSEVPDDMGSLFNSSPP